MSEFKSVKISRRYDLISPTRRTWSFWWNHKNIDMLLIINFQFKCGYAHQGYVLNYYIQCSHVKNEISGRSAFFFPTRKYENLFIKVWKHPNCKEYADFLYEVILNRGRFRFFCTRLNLNLWKFHDDMILNFSNPQDMVILTKSQKYR